MSTANERVKEVRTCPKINLTLEKFGERLGVGKTAISNIERGNRSLTEQMTKAICREFDVDYLWLTTGDAKMFLDIPPDAEISKYVTQLLGDTSDNSTVEFIKKMAIAYYKLDDKSKTVMDNFFSQLLDNEKEKP